jgi:hypothetical protein
VVVTKCEATFEIYTREVGPMFPLLNIIIIYIFLKKLILKKIYINNNKASSQEGGTRIYKLFF